MKVKLQIQFTYSDDEKYRTPSVRKSNENAENKTYFQITKTIYSNLLPFIH